MYFDLSVRPPKQWERYAGSRCAEAAEAYGMKFETDSIYEI